MAKRKSSGPSRPTARPATVETVVASPWHPGKTDRVQRVVDSVLVLRRAGRISAEQWQAAELYRDAYDAVRAGPGGAMDPGKTGGACGSRTPSTAAFDAGLRLREATRALDAIEVPPGGEVKITVVVEMVVGQGWTVEDAASAIHQPGADGRASGRNRAMVAYMLRLGLAALAEVWLRGGPRRARTEALVR